MVKNFRIIAAAVCTLSMCACGGLELSDISMEGKIVPSQSCGVKTGTVTGNITKTTEVQGFRDVLTHVIDEVGMSLDTQIVVCESINIDESHAPEWATGIPIVQVLEFSKDLLGVGIRRIRTVGIALPMPLDLQRSIETKENMYCWIATCS